MKQKQEVLKLLNSSQEEALRTEVLVQVLSTSANKDQFLKVLSSYGCKNFGKKEGWVSDANDKEWPILADVAQFLIGSTHSAGELQRVENFFKQHAATSTSLSPTDAALKEFVRDPGSSLDMVYDSQENRLQSLEKFAQGDRSAESCKALRTVLQVKNSRAEELALAALDKRKTSEEQPQLIAAIFNDMTHFCRDEFVKSAYEKISQIKLSDEEKGTINRSFWSLDGDRTCAEPLRPQMKQLANLHVAGGFSILDKQSAEWQNVYQSMLINQHDRTVRSGLALMHAAAEVEINKDNRFAKFIFEHQSEAKFGVMDLVDKRDFFISCYRDAELVQMMKEKSMIVARDLVDHGLKKIAHAESVTDEHFFTLAKIAIDSRSNQLIGDFFTKIDRSKISDFPKFKQRTLEHAIASAIPENVEELFKVLNFEAEATDLDKKKLLSDSVDRGLIKTTALLVKHGAPVSADAKSEELSFLSSLASQSSMIAIQSFIKAVCIKNGYQLPPSASASPASVVTPAHVDPSKTMATFGRRPSMSKSNLQSFVNQVDGKGRTALHHAALQGNDAAVEYLISLGAKLDVVDKDGNSAAHLAAQKGARATVDILKEKDQSLSAKQNLAGQTVESLLERKNLSEAEIPTILDGNILHYAVENRLNYDVRKDGEKTFTGDVNSLLDEKNKSGLNPLHLACKGASRTSLDQVLQLAKSNLSEEEFKSFINAKSAEGKTALHYLAANGREGMMDLLLQNGADIRSVDSNGNTALHYAVNAGAAITAVKLLQNGGADLARIHNSYKQSFLDCALQHGDSSVASEMLKHHDDVKQLMVGMVNDESKEHGATLLARAVRGGQDEVIEFLLGQKNGLGIKEKNPQHLADAIESGFEFTTKLLMSYGFNKLPENFLPKSDLRKEFTDAVVVNVANFNFGSAIEKKDQYPQLAQAALEKIKADAAEFEKNAKLFEQLGFMHLWSAKNSAIELQKIDQSESRVGFGYDIASQHRAIVQYLPNMIATLGAMHEAKDKKMGFDLMIKKAVDDSSTSVPAKFFTTIKEKFSNFLQERNAELEEQKKGVLNSGASGELLTQTVKAIEVGQEHTKALLQSLASSGNSPTTTSKRSTPDATTPQSQLTSSSSYRNPQSSPSGNSGGSAASLEVSQITGVVPPAALKALDETPGASPKVDKGAQLGASSVQHFRE